MLNLLKLSTFTLFAILILTVPVQARIGVGVNVGNIRIDEPLRPGGIYKLPPFSVINNGDETSTYRVSVAFFETQPERKPELSWFKFTSEEFELQPGGVQEIQTRLTLPLNAFSGDYFAFLEASPLRKEGQVSIGIAAATKLYFKVQTGSVLGAARERLITYWQNFGKTTLIVLVILAALIGLGYVSKNYQFALRKRK